MKQFAFKPLDWFDMEEDDRCWSGKNRQDGHYWTVDSPSGDYGDGLTIMWLRDGAWEGRWGDHRVYATLGQAKEAGQRFHEAYLRKYLARYVELISTD